MEVVKVVDVGLKRTATLTQVIVEVVDIGQVWPATIPLVIAEDMLIEVDLCHKRSATLPIVIREHELMLKEEVDKGLQPDTIPPMTKVNLYII